MTNSISQGFMRAMASLASGVAVVTVRTPSGEPTGLTVTSVCSYSAYPPSVLVSVDHGCRSYGSLMDAQRFGVHILHSGQERVAEVFASKVDHKFEGLAWRWEDEVPVMEDTLATLICRTSARFVHADHSILIGDVATVETKPGDPLIYLGRSLSWRIRGPDAASIV